MYIRQSTPGQVQRNLESQRLQYALVDRARQLGWAEVDVVDEDLGCTASGIDRPGFERMLGSVCEGKIGAIFSIEASRLARTGRDWHTLLEFCGVVGVLLIDADGIYDPRQINDRLVLGMKGTISEMEVATFRQRAQSALEQKAKRGELFRRVAIGYVRSGNDRIEKDPDERVRSAINLVFSKFRGRHRGWTATATSGRRCCSRLRTLGPVAKPTILGITGGMFEALLSVLHRSSMDGVSLCCSHEGSKSGQGRSRHHKLAH